MKMENISEKLNEINKTLEKIYSVMNKPVGKIRNALDIALIIVGISGMIFVIETILNILGA